jgi:hypothetical protein
MTAADERSCGPAKELFKLTDRTASDEVRENRFWANFLKSLGADFNITEPKSSYDLGEKCALLLIGLNQSDVNVRAGNFERQAWKTGAGSNVGQPTVFHRQQFGSVHGLAKMTSDYLNGIRNRSQANGPVPSE